MYGVRTSAYKWGGRSDAEACLWAQQKQGALGEGRAALTPPSVQQGFQLAQLRRPGIYKPFAIGIFLMVFQQLSGINAVMFYAETIFEEAKFKVKRPLPHAGATRVWPRPRASA